jgi:hypothetical protein
MKANETWVELLYFDGVEIHNSYGTIDGAIEEAILNKKETEWVRLNNVRYLSEDGTAMGRYEDDVVGTEHYFFLRASSIVRVALIRQDVTFWKAGVPPVEEITESHEDN